MTNTINDNTIKIISQFLHGNMPIDLWKKNSNKHNITAMPQGKMSSSTVTQKLHSAQS